jgi:hypothetical protein
LTSGNPQQESRLIHEARTPVLMFPYPSSIGGYRASGFSVEKNYNIPGSNAPSTRGNKMKKINSAIRMISELRFPILPPAADSF